MDYKIEYSDIINIWNSHLDYTAYNLNDTVPNPNGLVIRPGYLILKSISLRGQTYK